jgi:outer membrane protein TolC
LIDARIYDCDAEVKKLLKEITETYGSLAEGKIKLNYGLEILKRMQEILNLKKRTFTDGQLSYADVLKAEADVASVEKEIATILKEFKENHERICNYTGKTYDENIEFEKLVSDGAIQLTDFQKHISETPEYKARMKELEAIKFRSNAASNNFWPDISVYGRYDYYGNNMYGIDRAIKGMRETAYYAGLLITLPIFDGGTRKWERKRNMYELRKQEETLKTVLEEKGRDIKTLTAGYTEVTKALRHYKFLNEQYARMLEITKKSHPLGEKSMLDIMEMEKEAFGVERDLKVMEHAVALYEKRLYLEMDYKNYIMEHYGNRACKY